VSIARGFAALLCWVMALTSGAALALCLVLPPWIDYQAALAQREASQQRRAAIEQRLEAVRRQNEHLQNDPAYLIRLAREELGGAVQPPGAASVKISPSEQQAALDEQHAVPAPSGEAEDVLPELTVFLKQVLDRYPQAYLFVSEKTRPGIMAMSSALLLTAIVLLGRGVPRAAEQADA
jgi:hypothetical protein